MKRFIYWAIERALWFVNWAPVVCPKITCWRNIEKERLDKFEELHKYKYTASDNSQVPQPTWSSKSKWVGEPYYIGLHLSAFQITQ